MRATIGYTIRHKDDRLAEIRRVKYHHQLNPSSRKSPFREFYTPLRRGFFCPLAGTKPL